MTSITSGCVGGLHLGGSLPIWGSRQTTDIQHISAPWTGSWYWHFRQGLTDSVTLGYPECICNCWILRVFSRKAQVLASAIIYWFKILICSLVKLVVSSGRQFPHIFPHDHILLIFRRFLIDCLELTASHWFKLLQLNSLCWCSHPCSALNGS